MSIATVQLRLFFSVVLVALANGGCAPLAPAPHADSGESLDALKAEVGRLSGELGDLRASLTDVLAAQQAVSTDLDTQTHALGRVEDSIAILPERLKRLCPPAPRASAQCKPQVERVVVSGSKMVVGDIEQVWIDPPGFGLTAGIDTSAANNLLLGEDIVEFERDGKSWVRFVLHANDSDEPVSVERRVSRHVRAVQSGGTEVKRPVVRMRIELGDVKDTFSFVLTDRADQPVILGRSFLKDIALVEVGARYVQPRAKAAASGTEKRAP